MILMETEKKTADPPLRYAPVGMTIYLYLSMKGPRNCRSLGFARDDKGKGNGSMKGGCRTDAFCFILGGLAGP